MKEFIEEKMVQYFKKCSVDRYGQVGVVSPSQVFGNKTDEVLEYLSTDRMIEVRTYGGQFGTYEGFSLTYDVVDEGLRRKCYDILQQNENFKWAMTH